MTAIYNSIRPKLSVDRLAGTTNFCLGFTKDKNYYVPSSCLLEDIRNLADVTFQILAIFSKPATKNAPIYKDVRYVAKGVKLTTLSLSDELSSLISLENYTEKWLIAQIPFGFGQYSFFYETHYIYLLPFVLTIPLWNLPSPAISCSCVSALIWAFWNTDSGNKFMNPVMFHPQFYHTAAHDKT